MKIIDDKIENLMAFEDSINDTVRQIIVEKEPVIVELNAVDQLYISGVTRNNDFIAGYLPYRPRTIRIKRKKGQPIDRVTLRDTGDFHRSFAVIADNVEFLIGATDWKVDELVNKYGNEILGLTDVNLDKLVWEHIYPELMNKLRVEL